MAKPINLIKKVDTARDCVSKNESQYLCTVPTPIMEIQAGDNLFDALPTEILETIFVFCGFDAKNIARLEQVSKKCQQYCWRCQPSLDLHPYHSVVTQHVLRKLLKVTNYGKLKFLSLNTCVYIDGDHFPPLENLSSLEHLDLANCDTLDDKVFINSWNMPNLLSLNLRNTGVSSMGLMGLRKLTRLTSLDVYHCYNVSTLKLVSSLTNIKSLDCGFCDSMRVMSGIRDITSLQKLEVLNCQFYFFDNAFGLLTMFQHLTSLDVSQSSMVTKRGAALLANLTGLKSLNISWCDKLDDGGIKLLTTLVNLEELNIAYCRLLTDESMAIVGNFTKLTRLDISGISLLTDDGAKHLHALKGLREFHIDMCHNVSPAGVVDYRKVTLRQSANLKISTDSIDVD